MGSPSASASELGGVETAAGSWGCMNDVLFVLQGDCGGVNCSRCGSCLSCGLGTASDVHSACGNFPY